MVGRSLLLRKLSHSDLLKATAKSHNELVREKRPMRFLIIDDDVSTQKLLQGILSPYGDCDLVPDGVEATNSFRLALEEGRPYGLIFLDIMMPGMDGHQTLDSIRKAERDYHIQDADSVNIVMITAVNDLSHCIKAFEEGCACYISKPFTPKRILEQVQLLLGEMRKKTASPKSIAGDRNKDGSAKESTVAYGHRNRYLITDDDGVCRAYPPTAIAPLPITGRKRSMRFDFPWKTARCST
jgi:two-component system chemotaxis response regulator CheY